MNFNDLSMQGYDPVRQQWCRVVEIDIDRNHVGLVNGEVRFWRDLDLTKIKINKIIKNKKVENKFYYGDIVEILMGITTGKEGVVIEDTDNINKTNKIHVDFGDGWVGWYKRNELKLLKRNRRKNRILVV